MKVEIVVQSVADALAAERGGADRLELCSALRLGGLTPSVGLVRTVREATRLPVMAMIRPRAGGFCYSDSEFAAMELDIVALLEAGADGVVFGVLWEDGRLDSERCRRLVSLAAGREAVFHRAFDFTPSLPDALEGLVELGFARVLTTGGGSSAAEGLPMLRELVERAAGRIEVMPGGGVRSANVREIREGCRAKSVHLAPLVPLGDPLVYGGFEGVDEAEVRAVVRAVR